MRKASNKIDALKTKISTPLLEETQSFYQRIFSMNIVDDWDKPDDRGVILSFGGATDQALLEIYYSSTPFYFDGVSLQCKVPSIVEFVKTLPLDIEYEGPKDRPWGAKYVYLLDPNSISVIVYEGGS